MRCNAIVLYAATLFARSRSSSQTLTFQRTDSPVGQSPAGIAVGDFNKDGVPDLVVANFSGSSISVLPGNKDGTFQAAKEIPTGVSPPAFQFPVAEFGPGIFALQSGVRQAAAINPDGTLAGPTGSVPGVTLHPATPGQTIAFYATGLGAVTPAIDSGAAPGAVQRNTARMPTVLIGGVSAQVAFAGLSPQFVGVNQVNVVVPKVPTPGVAPLQIQDGTIVSSDKVTIAVGNP
jgi:uncharacterized protein (TIGR03437 family)